MNVVKLFAVVLVVLGLFLNGCNNPTTPETQPNTTIQYYYYEWFRVSVADYNSVYNSIIVTTPFNTIKNFRDRLKMHSVEFLESGTDGTQKELYDLCTSHGFAPSETNENISLLNDIGNNIFIFEYAFDSNYYLIMYVEKIS